MTTLTPDQMLTWGRTALASQPFSQLVGAELDHFAPGEAQLSMPLADRLLQQHGFVHGGVLAYLADNALTFAGGSVLGDSLTVEFKINYLRPAKDADRLVAVASVIGHGRTQAACRCEIYLDRDGARKLCAAAQGTIRKAREG